MTYQEADYFFSQDKKKYILKDNKKFLKWYKESIKYQLFSISELQYLIDFFFNWYKMKYPNKNDYYELEDISKYLTHEQMLLRLNPKYYNFLDNTYRTGSGLAITSLYKYSKEGDVIENTENKGMIAISISHNKIKTYRLGNIFCSIDGIVNKEQIIGSEPVYYDEHKNVITDEKFESMILSIFQEEDYLSLQDFYDRAIEKKSNYDFTEVKKTIELHKNEWKLRELIFSWVIEKIIFDKKSNPEESIERSLHFIEDIKNEYWNIHITEEIVQEYYNKILENVEKEKQKNLKK